MNLHSTKFGPSSKKNGPSAQMLTAVSNSVLHGCNPYHRKTVIMQQVDIGPAWGQVFTGDEFAGRFAQLFLTLPSLIKEPVRTQKFCERLKAKPTKAATILLEAIVAIERAVAGRMHRLDTVEFAGLFEPGEAGHIVACWSTRSPKLSKQCADAAIAGVNALLCEPGGKEAKAAQRLFTSLTEDLFAAARSRRLTPTVSVIREAAKARGIECAYLGTSYLRLGQGKHQLYFRGSLTGKTSHTASQLAVNKRIATRTLRAHRLPVPKQKQGKNAEAARRAADAIGYPVVVKPLRGNSGIGVTQVAGPGDVARAYKLASQDEPNVIVEEFIEGNHLRLLVIDYKLVAALRVVPPEIVGDGKRTVRQLIDELNMDPHRDGFRSFQIDLDDKLAERLTKFDLDMGTVLPDKEKFALREITNVSQGGHSIDVTDSIHPDYADAAERAARAIGLDVAGVDFFTPDIERSYKEVGGAIIELNARPGLCMHAMPRHGQSRDVGGAILDCIYPKGNRANVDTAVVVGEQRTAVVARDLDDILRLSERSVGLAIRSQAYVNGERCELKDGKKLRAVRSLLRDPQVDTLVSTQAPAGILRRGLQLDDVAVAAIRAPAPEADLQVFEAALDVVMKSQPRRLVFGVRNDLAMKAAEKFERSRITLVTRSGFTRRIRQHLAAGGHAVIAKWVDGVRHISIYEGENEVLCLPAIPKPAATPGEDLDAAPSLPTIGHRSRRIETRLYAVALALGLGVTVEQIESALAFLPVTTK